MRTIWNKISNTKSMMAVAGFSIIILSNLGFKLDNEVVMKTVEAVCGILVIIGVFNDKGMETGKFNE